MSQQQLNLFYEILNTKNSWGKNEIRQVLLEIIAGIRTADRLEAAEKSDAESIAMYRKARDERDTLRAKIETAENDAAHQKALAASALRVAKGWERKCGELREEVIYWKEQKEPGAAGWRALARILQAKIDAMEKQEPIGGMLEVSPHNYELRWYRPVPFGAKLYTLPGAKGE